jgi:hypothetical protein
MMNAVEFSDLEKHIADTDRQGGCQENMFLGPCDLCERYYDWVEQSLPLSDGGQQAREDASDGE